MRGLPSLYGREGQREPLPPPPELVEAKEVVRCGYMNPCEIQTFPIAGREAFIYIRRRRWKEKGARESFFNTYKYTI